MQRAVWMCHCALAVAILGVPRMIRADAFAFDFGTDAGRESWSWGFADYAPSEEENYALTAEVRTLPDELPAQPALYLSGFNQSDDLFMFYKRQVGGLQPDTLYDVTFFVEFATQYEDGLIGIGGSPSNSVYVKAGATPVEPLADRLDDQDVHDGIAACPSRAAELRLQDQRNSDTQWLSLCQAFLRQSRLSLRESGVTLA